MMSWDVVNNMLLWMTTLFFLIVMAYFLVRIDKRNKKIHAGYLVGKWQRMGKDPEGNEWFINYAFTNAQQFEINAYPPLHTKGNYQIIKEVENLMVVQLFNISGDGNTDPHRIQIAIDKKANKVTIDERVFKRIG